MRDIRVRSLLLTGLLLAACQGGEPIAGPTSETTQPSPTAQACTVRLLNSDSAAKTHQAQVAAATDGFMASIAPMPGINPSKTMRRFYNQNGEALPGSTFDPNVSPVPPGSNGTTPFQTIIGSAGGGYLISAFDNTPDNWLVRMDNTGTITAAAKQIHQPNGNAEMALRADDGDWAITHEIDSALHTATYTVGRVDQSANLEPATKTAYSFTVSDVSCTRIPVMAKIGDTIAVANTWSSADQTSRHATLYLKRPGEPIKAIELSKPFSNSYIATNPPLTCDSGGNEYRVTQLIAHNGRFVVLWTEYVPGAHAIAQVLSTLSIDGNIVATVSPATLIPEEYIYDIASLPHGYAVSTYPAWSSVTGSGLTIRTLDETFHPVSSASLSTGQRTWPALTPIAINPTADRLAIGWDDADWNISNPAGHVAFFSLACQ